MSLSQPSNQGSNAFGNAPALGGGTGAFGSTTGGMSLFGNKPGTTSTFGTGTGASGNTGTSTGGFGPGAGSGGFVNTGAGTFGNTGTGTGGFGSASGGANVFGNTPTLSNAFGGTNTGTSAFGNPAGGNSAFGTFGTGADATPYPLFATSNTNSNPFLGGTNTPNPNPLLGGTTSNPLGGGSTTNHLGGTGSNTLLSSSINTTNLNPLSGGSSNSSSNPLFGGSANAGSNPLLGGSTNTGSNSFLGGSTNTGSNPLLGGSTNTGSNTLFGGTTNNNSNPLFGGTNTNANVNQPSQFGSNPFAQTQMQNQTQTSNSLGSGTSNLFSSTANQNPFGTSTLGSSPNPLFGTKPVSSTVPSAHMASSASIQQGLDLQQKIEAIVAAWNPQSPHCRFQHYFYNLVDRNQVSLYGRPLNATNDVLWHQAVRENPDPTCMVPVLAAGFDDLQKRVDAQSAMAKQHHDKLKELQTRLTALSQTHVLQTALRTTRALQAHTVITHRLLRVIEHLHLLIPSLRSSSISPEEEALRARLERLKDELVVGGGRGRLNELWAVVGAVKAARESTGIGEGIKWKVVDWEGLERLTEVLNEQQQGLAHLTSVINNGLKDLQIMEGIEPTPHREGPGAGGVGFGASGVLGQSTSRGFGSSQPFGSMPDR